MFQILRGSRRSCALAVASLPLLASLASPQDDPGQEGSGQHTWQWSSNEEKQLTGLAKDAREQDEVFFVHDGLWNVEARTAREAAECSLFLDLFEAEYFELVDVQRQVYFKPTLVVLPDRGTYRARTRDERTARFDYQFDTVPNPPVDGRRVPVRIVWQLFHVFTYPVAPDKEGLAALDLPLIQLEVAKALLQAVTGTNELNHWLSDGLPAFFQALDVRADGKDRFEERRKRSFYQPILRHDPPPDGEYPDLSSILDHDTASWRATTGDERYRLVAYAETLVDVLLTDRAFREDLEEHVESQGKKESRPPSKGPRSTRGLKRLEKAWHELLDQIAKRE
jgi:hypothetical protein